MRDPNRISDFCNRLAAAWGKLPDWRFFQLITNLPFERDPFYMEDDEAIEFIEAAVEKWTEGQN